MACKHTYRFCDQAHYVRCELCGTYHSLVAPPPAEVYTADYWSHERGHSTMEEQVYNCDVLEIDGKTKNQFLLDRIEVEDRSAALEVGCAPGAMLKRLYECGFEKVAGIEMQDAFYSEIRRNAVPYDPFLWFWPFPSGYAWMDTGKRDLIVASDVFEHSHEPEAFLSECARLLRAGGQLLMMLPLMSPELLGTRFFQADEHVYIHSASNLCIMLQEAGFDWHGIKIDHWTLGHDTVSARRSA